MLELKVKKLHPDAKLPTKAHASDAAFDLSLVFYPGDRIFQLLILPVPQVAVVEVDELSSSERGTGGFGSTGK